MLCENLKRWFRLWGYCNFKAAVAPTARQRHKTYSTRNRVQCVGDDVYKVVTNTAFAVSPPQNNTATWLSVKPACQSCLRASSSACSDGDFPEEQVTMLSFSPLHTSLLGLRGELKPVDGIDHCEWFSEVPKHLTVTALAMSKASRS